MTGAEAEAESRHWLVAGGVQGVGYRWWLVERAREAGIDGWVRNLRDGRVEAVVRGGAAALDALEREARRGPAAASVREVASRRWDRTVGRGFGQAPTADRPDGQDGT